MSEVGRAVQAGRCPTCAAPLDTTALKDHVCHVPFPMISPPQQDYMPGGESGMAGVGRRAFQAVAQAAVFAQHINVTNNGLTGMQGRRPGQPQYLDIASRSTPPLSPASPLSPAYPPTPNQILSSRSLSTSPHPTPSSRSHSPSSNQYATFIRSPSTSPHPLSTSPTPMSVSSSRSHTPTPSAPPSARLPFFQKYKNNALGNSSPISPTGNEIDIGFRTNNTTLPMDNTSLQMDSPGYRPTPDITFPPKLDTSFSDKPISRSTPSPTDSDYSGGLAYDDDEDDEDGAIGPAKVTDDLLSRDRLGGSMTHDGLGGTALDRLGDLTVHDRSFDRVHDRLSERSQDRGSTSSRSAYSSAEGDVNSARDNRYTRDGYDQARHDSRSYSRSRDFLSTYSPPISPRRSHTDPTVHNNDMPALASRSISDVGARHPRGESMSRGARDGISGKQGVARSDGSLSSRSGSRTGPTLSTRTGNTSFSSHKGKLSTSSSSRSRTRICVRCRCIIDDGRWIRMEGGDDKVDGSVGSRSGSANGKDEKGVLCEECWKGMYLPKCRRCTLPIEHSAVFSSDGQLKGKYHRHCFTCITCSTPFPDKTFYVYDGKPMCALHYHEANATLCGTCGRGIEGRCIVTERGERFHEGCLRCSVRGCAGLDGRGEYWEVEGDVVCERHANGEGERDEEGREMHAGRERATKRTTRLIDLPAGWLGGKM